MVNEPAASTASEAKPLIYVLDASVDVTGGLIAVKREVALLRDEARFVIVLPEDTRVPAAALREFEHVLRIPVVPIRKSLRSVLVYGPALLAAGRRLARAMRADGCERLQVNDFYLMEGAVARLFGYRGRIVTWVRFDPARFGRALSGLLLRAVQRSSDAVVGVSSFVMTRLQTIPEAKLLYDPLEVDPDKLPRKPEGQRLLYVGNYINGKGQERAIEAFDRIAGQFPRAELVFHGGDMGLPKNRLYKEHLEAQAAASAAADRIHFRGFESDLAEVRASSYAALNFSRSETFSLTCQEASAAGLPVIATRSGGPQEIIKDGDSGFLVPVDDVEAMATAMSRLLSDPDLAARMGARGKEIIASRFAPQHFRDQAKLLFQLP